MSKIEHEIRENLYGFYDQIARIGEIHSERLDQCSLIGNHPGTWPRIIYRIAPQIAAQESCISFSGKVNSGTYPEVLIASDQNIKEVDPFLRSKGFYPFSAWKGMAINATTLTVPVLPKTIEVIKPESPEDIEQWLAIVTSGLLAPDRLDRTLYENLTAHPEFEAYLLKYNGLGVSTILVFKTENSTGLYFIATDKTAQRQGFASMLVQQILFQETQKSLHLLVLHATPKGEALYSKLGFQPFNQFFLYRFIPTHQ